MANASTVTSARRIRSPPRTTIATREDATGCAPREGGCLPRAELPRLDMRADRGGSRVPADAERAHVRPRERREAHRLPSRHRGPVDDLRRDDPEGGGLPDPHDRIRRLRLA